MKLWEKDIDTKKEVMQFTVGNDPDYDKELAPYDVIGSMAHAIMLGETGLISKTESQQLVEELALLYKETIKEDFYLHPDAEDIHSHLEMVLMDKLGDTGKKIHTARSRNDQVMTALMLMLKEEEKQVTESVKELFDILIHTGEHYKAIQIPGYTHMQVAMPSSIALWLGAYAESLVGDMMFADGIISAIDQSPLGSAAGYGSSFPIDRDLTAKLAGFSSLQISSASAQLSRGKMETLVAYGLSSIAMTLSRLAADAILFMSQNMNFISFPDELTTGSSIMPHKKNPDVLELIRAHCNKIIQLPSLLAGMSANLVSGYHRDFQLTKEILFPAIEQLKQCLKMMGVMISNMKVREGILEEDTYKYIFSVEEVNKKVIEGATFRDAYREVAADIDQGKYKPGRGHLYTHVGSIGNPGLDRIVEKMDAAMKQIRVIPAEKIFEDLKTYYSK